MKPETARILMRAFRAGQSASGNDPRVEKAARYAAKHEELRSAFQAQCAFDEAIGERVDSLPLPPTLGSCISGAAAAQGHPNSWKALLCHPAILSVTIGVLLIFGLLIYFAADRMEHFEGKEALTEMLATTDEMTGNELVPIETEAGKLADWLFLKYGLEHYNVPVEFSSWKTVGSRVFNQGGHSVAQIAVDNPNLLLFLFRAGDFPMKLDSPGQWRVFEQEEWVAAIRVQGAMGVMIAFRGSAGEMDQVLAGIESPGAR